MNWQKIDKDNLPTKMVWGACLDKTSNQHHRYLFGFLKLYNLGQDVQCIAGTETVYTCTHYFDIEQLESPQDDGQGAPVGAPGKAYDVFAFPFGDGFDVHPGMTMLEYYSGLIMARLVEHATVETAPMLVQTAVQMAKALIDELQKEQ